MTDTDKPTANNNAPSHVAYQVRDKGDGQKGNGYWTRIGAAWRHADGNGFNVQHDAVPLDGRVTLRVATEKKD